MNTRRAYACGHLMPRPAGREPDIGDGVTIYRHTFAGFTIRTHRTVRTTPAGWVYGVHDEHGQYTYGYAGSQRDALCTAAHYIAGACPFPAAPMARVS